MTFMHFNFGLGQVCFNILGSLCLCIHNLKGTHVTDISELLVPVTTNEKKKVTLKRRKCWHWWSGRSNKRKKVEEMVCPCGGRTWYIWNAFWEGG